MCQHFETRHETRHKTQNARDYEKAELCYYKNNW